MGKALNISLLMAASLWLSACQTTSELAQQQSQDLGWEHGKTFSGTFKLSRFDAPLPEGQWVLLKSNFSTNNSQQGIEYALLARTENSTITHLLSLKATQTRGSGQYNGWEDISQCSKMGMGLWKYYKQRAKDQDCWGIGVTNLSYLKNDATAAPVMTTHGLAPIGRSILTMHHFADAAHFLDITLFTPFEELRHTYGNAVPNELVNWVDQRRMYPPEETKSFLDTLAQKVLPRHTQLASVFKSPK